MTLTVGGVATHTAWPLPDGSFTFRDVPEGLHLLEVVADGAQRLR